MNRLILFATVFGVISVTALAQTPSPYAGQEAREIKALSRQEVTDYLDGKGMGYAKAAELNHYPGPRHVLDMAAELGLSEEQIERSEAIFAAMKARAMSLGKQLVAKETELDRLFASGSIDPASLETLLSAIGSLHAELRYAHLNAHLEQRTLLTQHQIHRYDQLRGYGSDEHHHSGHAH